MVYLVITIASVEATDLFFPNHTLSLPILRIDLNITYFFAATPIVILVVHTNLLVNLSHHRNKLEAYIQEDETASPMYYHPFLYNFIRKRPDRNHKYRFATTTLLRIFIWTSLVILPLFVLILLQLRFLPVQTGWVNILHVVLVFVDAVVLWWFRTAISTQAYPDRPQASNTNPEEDSHAVSPPTTFDFQKVIKLLLVISTPLLSLLLYSASQISTGKSSTFHFDLQEMVLAESQSDVQSILGSAPKLETAWAELAMGDKVENKLIQYGAFDRSIFTRISFRGSDLSHSSFRYTRFEYVSFQESQALHTDFTGAFIRVGLFYLAEMDNAQFVDAELATVDFDSCVMRHGNFTDATMYGASFVDADLSGTDFTRAQLAGADFSNAILDGAEFYSADLTGANFSNAQLRGAMFVTSKLNGTDFTNAIMLGATIVNCPSAGTNFNGSILDGAFIQKLNNYCLGWRNISNPDLISLTVASDSLKPQVNAAWYTERIPEKVHILPQSEALEPRAAFLEKLERINLDCLPVDLSYDIEVLDTARYIRFRDSLFCNNAFANEQRTSPGIFVAPWLRNGRKRNSEFNCNQ